MTTKTPAKRGRPSKKTPDRCEAVIRRLKQGEPLTVIAADLGVCDDTVRRWESGDDEFTREVARARHIGEYAIAQRARAIAAGAEGISSGDVQRDKLMVETELKLQACWNPRYNPKQTIEHSGEVKHSGMTPEERAEALKQFLAANPGVVSTLTK